MEQQLKQRLVGAIVLVSLAVIFIPVILEGPDDEWAPRTHDIPAPPELDYRASMDLSIPDTVQPAAQEPEAEPPAAARPAQAPPPAPAAQPAEERQPPPAQPAHAHAVPPAPASPPTRQADTPTPGWYAQLGSFGQRSNATSLQDALARTGVAVQIQKVATGKGSTYRVLAGPESDRSRAEILLRKLGKQLKTTGIVIEIGAGG